MSITRTTKVTNRPRRPSDLMLRSFPAETDATIFPSAVQNALRLIQEHGVKLSKSIDSQEGLSDNIIVPVLHAVDEYIRAQRGRETKTCSVCRTTVILPAGISWDRNMTYNCKRKTCKGKLLSAGEYG